jgi:hypothetical protein
MKTKTSFPSTLLLSVLFAVLLPLAFVACAGGPAPVTVTTQQQQIAAAVEDALSIGLVPVFTRNPSYREAAQGIAAALGTFNGATITPDDVNAVLAKTGIAAQDAQVVAGLVNAAWATYQRRYAQQVGASVRPDVKLFLAAVSAGITNAVAATPR